MVNVVMFRESDGSVPLLDWLDTLVPDAQAKCLVRIERLEAEGHKLRRPEADYLEDGIYELRAKHQRVNLRILYFFQGQEAVVLSHGLAKQQAKVPKKAIKEAKRRKARFERDPTTHTFEH